MMVLRKRVLATPLGIPAYSMKLSRQTAFFTTIDNRFSCEARVQNAVLTLREYKDRERANADKEIRAHFANPLYALHTPDADSTCEFLNRFIRGPIPCIPASPPLPPPPLTVAPSPVGKEERKRLFVEDFKRKLAQIV